MWVNDGLGSDSEILPAASKSEQNMKFHPAPCHFLMLTSGVWIQKADSPQE